MRNDVQKHQMTSNQLFILALKVCQWWNAVFIQADRFFNVLYAPHGETPWDKDENYSLFGADRMFLIVAIHHAIEDLQKLNIELQRDNDTSLQFVLDNIEKVAPWEDVKNLRDMNIHDLDYLVEKGQKQDKFRSKVKIGDGETLITAAWTHINHDVNVVLVGKIKIKELLSVMETHLPFIRQKTKQIYDESLFGKH